MTLSQTAADEFIAIQRKAGYNDESILVIAQNDRDSGTLTDKAFYWVRETLAPQQQERGGMARNADAPDNSGPAPEEGYDEVGQMLAALEGEPFAADEPQQYANGGILPSMVEKLHREAASKRYFPHQPATPAMHALSVRLRAAVVDLGAVLEEIGDSADPRNLALAKTALEDVQMRANRALHSPNIPHRGVDLQVKSNGIDIQKHVDLVVARNRSGAYRIPSERAAEQVAGHDA